MNTKHILLCVVATSMLAPSVARADLGSQGVIAIQGQPRLELGHQTTTDPDGDSSSSTQLGIGVLGQYFVADHVAIGGGFQAVRQWEDDDDTETTIVAQLLASYQLPVRSGLHLWPQALVGVIRQTVDLQSNPKLTVVAGSIYVPVVLEVADHLLIGWGPIAGTTLHSSYERSGYSEDAGKSKVLGTQAMVAGWF